ncbi:MULTISPECIES: YgaP family membrane protein [Nocardia]|uniref:YgaP family membrane protein n=1 Tax=Nocardia TaxID=1817 RepID=UPI000D69B662|nr:MULTISPECIES: DUF2892 domain-containing protein [Nocardia]
MPQLPRQHGWSIPRVVPLLAGFMVLVSALLTAVVSPWWLLLTAFVAANLLLYGTLGWCPASLVMARVGIPASATACPTHTRESRSS